MPYVPVPKDLTKVKTKLAFNLTKRQLIVSALPDLSAFRCISYGATNSSSFKISSFVAVS